MIRKTLVPFAIGALALAGCAASSNAQGPIDREALVTRHTPVLTEVDPHAPLMIGYGDIGFTADITGLQTFPDQYADLAPLMTMAQWAWHTATNPEAYTEEDGLRPIPVEGRGERPYGWMESWDDAETNPAYNWLRANPHRFSLGRMSLALTGADGEAAAFEDLAETTQTLDMWSGVLTSNFQYDGQPVSVETRVHPDSDMVFVRIVSPLVENGRLGVDVRFPGVSDSLNPDPSDWNDPEGHSTRILEQAANRVALERRIDETTYFADIDATGGVEQTAAHDFRVTASGANELVVMVRYAPQRDASPVPGFDEASQATTAHWRDYWSEGGVIDFTGSTDPRAAELERRVVLSQYLLALNSAGEIPPQEEGLFSNSWNGKFHLEMHPWHAAHFAMWGRPELMERSLPWYLGNLENARAQARLMGVRGAWWPKMAGPEGRNSPSLVTPFIMWQQPHPILMAELARRADPDGGSAERYAELVEASAELLASWPIEADGRFNLGPPLIPAQENYDPFTTVNPTYEVEYFHWALQTAQAWRERAGQPRNAQWDEVIERLAPPPVEDGLYLPVESMPDFWRTAASEACDGDATGEGCDNRDHPSFLMAYGFIGGDRIDPEIMLATLEATEAHWDIRQTWGWDFPMVAMTAARLGEREKAVDWLFADLKNNQWGVSGMTPRVHLDEHADALVPVTAGAGGTAETAANVGPDGPGYRRAAETYFPSNGSLLWAVGMMAAGWDGSEGHAPGFPEEGWTVRVEGVEPAP